MFKKKKHLIKQMKQVRIFSAMLLLKLFYGVFCSVNLSGVHRSACPVHVQWFRVSSHPEWPHVFHTSQWGKIPDGRMTQASAHRPPVCCECWFLNTSQASSLWTETGARDHIHVSSKPTRALRPSAHINPERL